MRFDKDGDEKLDRDELTAFAEEMMQGMRALGGQGLPGPRGRAPAGEGRGSEDLTRENGTHPRIERDGSAGAEGPSATPRPLCGPWTRPACGPTTAPTTALYSGGSAVNVRKSRPGLTPSDP